MANKYLAFGRDDYCNEHYGFGDSTQEALDNLIATCEELQLGETVFYKVEHLNLKVDIKPRIVSAE